MTSISRPIGHLEDSGVIVVIIRLAHLKKKKKEKNKKRVTFEETHKGVFKCLIDHEDNFYPNY